MTPRPCPHSVARKTGIGRYRCVACDARLRLEQTKALMCETCGNTFAHEHQAKHARSRRHLAGATMPSSDFQEWFDHVTRRHVREEFDSAAE